MKRGPTVFVVDDDAAVRDSLSLLLGEKGMVVETFESAEAFLRVCRSAPNACVVLDFRMQGMDGIALQRELSKRGIVLPVIFLTGHGDIPHCIQAIKAGAYDFLAKPVSAAVLLESVQAALLESERLSTHAKMIESTATGINSLTERERQVMELAIEGKSNKEIARRMGISHRTVEIHRARLMFKTGATSLVELARVVSAIVRERN